MASNKPRNQKALSDEGPIVFPSPSCNPSDVFPPDFPQPSDLVVDPHGNFYCFVCQVSVPKGDASVSQHLGGKKHDNHNKRFTSEQQKDHIRQAVLRAAKEQRLARPVATPVDPPSSTAEHSPSVQTPSMPVASHPVQQSASEDLNSLSAEHKSDKPDKPPQSTKDPNNSEPAQNTRKAKRLAEAKRMRSFKIDKQAYLSEILAKDSDSSSESDSPDSDLQRAAEDELSQRLQPFGPLNFKPPEGPDYFFESMPEETAPSAIAAKLRGVLAKKDEILPDAPTKSVVESEDKEEDGEGNGFLSFKEDEQDRADKQEKLERANAMQKARESLIILKDESGEELPPWLLNSEATERVLYSSDSSVSLHYEILEFSQFVSPTEAELESRSEMIMTVESIVSQLWPASTTQIFGSYATDLYLPSSDIDICIMGTPLGGELQEFEQLAEAIRNVTGFARRVHVVKATVRLVKIISRKTSMNCDISIGVPNGPKYVPVIKEYAQSYPALRPLLLVIKCFLQQRDLNEVFRGGLGSYTVLLLVVSHLQMLKCNFQRSKTNLGALLQQFFQLYGRMHNLCLAGIQVKDNGCYFDKYERYQTAPEEVLRLSIEDPNDVTNELGRNSYAVSRVRRAFANASKTLVNWRRDHSNVPPTPLNAILQPDERFRFRRTQVIEDMQTKGHKPLRESLAPLNKRHVQLEGPATSSRGQAYADAVHEADGAKAPISIGNGSTHQWSSDRRRERDPRLAKRRRTAVGDDRSRTAGHSSNNEYGALRAGEGSSRLNSHSSSQRYLNSSNQSMGDMYNQTMAYGHNAYNQAGYAPATPGYQYVGGPRPFTGNSMASAFDAQNYVQTRHQMMSQQGTGQFPAQYTRNYDNNGANRARGRQMKRGYRPRRGNQRDR